MSTLSLLDGMQVLKSAHDDSSSSLKIKSLNSLVPTGYDYISRTLTTSTRETYLFKSGGSGGTLVGTIVINYTDSTLAAISDVTRT